MRGYPPCQWGPKSTEGRMATVKHALSGKSPATDAAAEMTAAGMGKGLTFQRFFTDGKKSPFDAVEWEKRTALIGNEKGVTIFRQEDVEVPKSWSQTATNIVTSKYFHGKPGTPGREGSVRQLISRVANTIVRWGEQGGYFADAASRETFRDELTHLLVEQKMAFNSPVWFNVGVQPKPQCSACFINSVRDDMGSIMDLAKTEGMLFKWGSGTGTNFSTLRGSKETLSGGGIASGPVSFMKGFDAFAGVIKSGGKTRRAAKMVILNIDHPDIVEFIECKMKEERKAHVLIEQGYDSSIDGDAYASIFFQNANHSVRVTDDFMRAVVEDKDWWTKNVIDGQPNEKLRARDLMLKISDSTWHCGDPGMQYDTTVNRWHTSKNTARINASNPCSEYMFLDDSACNLASLNLLKFAPNGTFDVEAYRHAVDILITAQEIIVDNAGYPTEMIMRNSHDYRPLGLGYANLGALLMACGLPYDSDAGRDYAACVTAIMCGEAYLQSSRIAELCEPLSPATEATKKGLAETNLGSARVGTGLSPVQAERSSAAPGAACPGWYINREPFLDVIRMHRASVNNINKNNVPSSLYEASKSCWDEALAHGEKFGYRNSQVTVLAPTGTIGFFMDCDTTGVEPDLALVKYKKLVGGGMIKIVNQTVPTALFKLAYDHDQTDAIVSYIDATGTIEGAPHIKDEHLAVFDCSFKPAKGTRSIHYMGRLKMMAAAQPFISGAISKTVNLPESASVEEIIEAYLQAWKLGLKAVAVYRDGCKKSQPLSAAGTKTASSGNQAGEGARPTQAMVEPDLNGPPRAVRHKLPEERMSVTHKFNIGGHEGYITVGLYPDGSPGEIFITMAKESSTVSGLMDSFALAVSIALQHGVPLKLLCEKFAHTRFEPSGWTNNTEIGFAKSIMDYIFRWLQLRFLTGQQQLLFENLRPRPATIGPQPEDVGRAPSSAMPVTNSVHAADALSSIIDLGDAPTCSFCGSIMVRNGSCYKCMSCGSTSGGS